MQIGEGMDYLRDGLFSAQQLQGMEQVGVSTAGICLANLLEAVVKRAIHSDGARLVAFGQAFKDLSRTECSIIRPAGGYTTFT
jgi:hypothetical protein